jgi:hypothetical protein
MPSIILNRDPDDEDPIVRPGEVVRVPLPFMDALSTRTTAALAALTKEDHMSKSPPLHDGRGRPAGHAPGYAYLGTADELAQQHERTEAARAAWKDRLSNAWRNPNARSEPAPPVHDQKGRAQAAYADYLDRITNAWKG